MKKDRFGYTYFIIADLIIKIPISVDDFTDDYTVNKN